MKIGYLGAGTWGFALATILAKNGHDVVMWTRDLATCQMLQKTRIHPKLPSIEISRNVEFTSDLEKAVHGKEVIVESVTSSGIRSVFEKIGKINIPVILTSKGIEQGTGLL